ncbi:MAG: DUF3990 domain-containing protein [Chitinispirillales bacterium]|jgi:hypothetical protein|nr:DUF3990 domain-containing protein [Chitinispirillales bacterium]
MIIYHGSYTEIKQIDLSKCEPYKDFGKGFYATNIRKQAEIWAAKQGKRYGNTGFVTGFKFTESAFEDSDYKTLKFTGYTDEWFEFVIKNRDKNAKIPAHNFDIVEGPVANDNIVVEIGNYLRKVITKEYFFRELSKYPDPTHQICFCTMNSLRSIERIDLQPLSKMEIIGNHIVANLITTHDLPKDNATDLFYNSETLEKLSDESTGLYEKSWQEIYTMLVEEQDEAIAKLRAQIGGDKG